VQKRQSSQQCHLALLGPTSVKAAHKMLVNLTPDFQPHSQLVKFTIIFDQILVNFILTKTQTQTASTV